jgi:hypothetical protein
VPEGALPFPSPGVMIRQVVGAVVTAALGAAAAAICLTVAFTLRPDVVFEMDRDLPRQIARELYPTERAGDLTFAWTAARADITLAGLNRETPWVCMVRYRGGRGEPMPQPVVDLAVDGITLDRRTATNEFEDVEVTAPVRPFRPGLTLSIGSSTTVVPGPADRRELGVQIERVACRPEAAGLLWPPRRALHPAMAAAALFGATFVLAGSALGSALVGTAAVAVLQALPLSAGVAPYSAFPGTLLRLALWTALLMLAAVKLFEVGTRRPLASAARFVVLFSACALYIKLAGLLHPSKLLIDALFHAHRFQAVLDGGYYFTQVMPGGVSFPYAIALYVFAAPWSVLTRDYVSLLRIVVCAAEIGAGALIYLMIVRTRGDRIAGALGVVLFSLVPLPYGLVGNANLTSAFGQSAALATLAAATIWTPGPPRQAVQIAGLFLLASLAFLSHISTAALLGVTLTALALLYRVRGGPALHRTAWTLLGVTAAAALFSVAIYYGHFADVYRTLERVRPDVAASAPGDHRAGDVPAAASAPAATPLPRRVAHALGFSVAVIGWPIVLLGVLGVPRIGQSGNRLALVVAAWALAYGVFFGIGILPRVDAQFERYAAEFVGRVVFATYPAVIVLAAVGAAWAWRAGLLARIVAAGLLAWAAFAGLQQWTRWFTE